MVFINHKLITTNLSIVLVKISSMNTTSFIHLREYPRNILHLTEGPNNQYREAEWLLFNIF